MPAIDAYMLEGVLEWLARSSWEAVVVIALILAAQRLARPWLTPQGRYALWLLLPLKLALPLAPQAPFSIFSIAGIEALAGAFAEPGVASNTIPPIGGGGTAGLSQSATSPSAPALSQPVVMYTLLGIWLGVALALFVRMLYVNIRIARVARLTRPLVETRVLEALEDCKAELAVYTPVTIIVSAAVNSPALFGFVRPRLLLPPLALDALTDAELRHVLLHELAHVKRRDIIAHYVIALLRIAYWFHPALWFAFRRMRSDMEIACDALVVRAPRTSMASAYGRTILKMLELNATPRIAPAIMGILEDRRLLQRRMRHIVTSGPKPHSVRIAAALALLLGGLTLTEADMSGVSEGRQADSTQSTYSMYPQYSKELLVNQLPEVHRIALDADMLAVCTEVFGAYDTAHNQIMDVAEYMQRSGLAFEPNAGFGVYFDDPSQTPPEKLRSFQGVIVSEAVTVEEPYFLYRMSASDYLYTKVQGDPQRILDGYAALFNYMGSKKVAAGSTGGHQIARMIDGVGQFEIYMKVDE